MPQDSVETLDLVVAFTVLAVFLVAMAVWWRQSSNARRLGRLQRALAEGRADEVLAAPVPSGESASPTLVLQAQAALLTHDPDRARQLAAAAAAAAEATGCADRMTPVAYRLHCLAAYELDDHADLRFLLGDGPTVPWARWMRVDVALATGEDALAEQLLDADGWPAEAEARRLVTTARLRLGQQRLAEARELLDHTLALLASPDLAGDRQPWQSLAQVLDAQVALADGRPEDARDGAAAALAELPGSPADDAVRLSALTVLAATGDPDEAERHLALTDPPAYRSAQVEVLRQWAEAEIAAARGDLPRARHLLSAAVERAEGAGLTPRAAQLARRLDALSPSDM